MTGVLLTQYQGKIVGPVAWVLGHPMNGIFNVLNAIGIPNIGLSIIIFTIVIYLCLLPLTYKQQKFSNLQSKMSPELKAIQDKYKGKKDNDSMMAMQWRQKSSMQSMVYHRQVAAYSFLSRCLSFLLFTELSTQCQHTLQSLKMLFHL